MCWSPSAGSSRSCSGTSASKAVEIACVRLYTQSVKELRDRKLKPEAFADVVERQVLPPWNAERARIAALSPTDQPHQALANRITMYMDLRGEAWRLRVDGIRRNRVDLLESANRKEAEALALSRAIK